MWPPLRRARAADAEPDRDLTEQCPVAADVAGHPGTDTGGGQHDDCQPDHPHRPGPQRHLASTCRSILRSEAANPGSSSTTNALPLQPGEQFGLLGCELLVGQDAALMQTGQRLDRGEDVLGAGRKVLGRSILGGTVLI